MFSLPPQAQAYILTVEVLVGALALVLTFRMHFVAEDTARAALLVGLSILYTETADRAGTLRRYFHPAGRGHVWSDMSSVWTFAAALLLPYGYAILVVVGIYANSLMRARRHKPTSPNKIVFACTTTLFGTIAVVAARGLLGVRLADGGAAAAIMVLLTLLVYTTTSFAGVATVVYLTRTPSPLRAVPPGADEVAFEMTTLILGVLTATLIVANPWLLPGVFILTAVLQRSTQIKELEAAVSIDSKTDMLNAGGWHTLAQQNLLRAQRRSIPVSVLMIDLDHFKAVNDEFGHLVGDLALKAVADCLKDELRGYDAVGRFGGEEFVAVLDGVEKDAALSIAVRLTEAIRALTPGAGELESPVSLTASIGVAGYPADGTDLDGLIKAADAALYRAKGAGRDQVCPADGSAHVPNAPSAPSEPSGSAANIAIAVTELATSPVVLEPAAQVLPQGVDA